MQREQKGSRLGFCSLTAIIPPASIFSSCINESGPGQIRSVSNIASPESSFEAPHNPFLSPCIYHVLICVPCVPPVHLPHPGQRHSGPDHHLREGHPSGPRHLVCPRAGGGAAGRVRRAGVRRPPFRACRESGESSARPQTSTSLRSL